MELSGVPVCWDGERRVFYFDVAIVTLPGYL